MNRDKAKELADKFLSEAIPFLENKDDQILIIMYNNDGMMSTGYGCRACSVEAAVEYAEINTDLQHSVTHEPIN